MLKRQVLLSLICLFSTAAITQTADVRETSFGPNDPSRPAQQEHKRPIFSDIDLDGSGYITLDEFRQHALPFGEHSEVFQRFDVNQDGEISRDEFINHKPPHRNQSQGAQKPRGGRND